MSWTWRDNPLSIALRRILREYPLDSADSPVLEAQSALRWAEEQDEEVERIAARITSECREEVALEFAAPELADALEAILANDGSQGTFDASALYAAHGKAIEALRKAGREIRGSAVVAADPILDTLDDELDSYKVALLEEWRRGGGQ